MPYWMTNPDHGVMPVYDLSEVERVKGFGWSLLNEGPSPAREAPKEKKELSASDDMKAVMSIPPNASVKRKPGRPAKAK